MKRVFLVWVLLLVFSSLIAGGSSFRFLALGDSYTIGQGVREEERWPAQVARILEDEVGFAVQVDYRAQPGWTTGNLRNSLENSPPEGTYDLVTLLIGTNNQFQRQEVELFLHEFGFLLGLAIDYAGGDPSKVKVLSIPDYRYTPFASRYPLSDQDRISREIDQYNVLARGIATTHRVAFLDLSPLSRQGLQDPSLIAGDGLHLSGKAYGQFAARVVQDMVCRLDEPPRP